MKNKTTYFLVTILLLISSGFMWVEPAHACSCDIAQTPEESYKRAEIVFRGKAITTFTPSVLPYSRELYRWLGMKGASAYDRGLTDLLREHRAEFEVVEAWKGINTTATLVHAYPEECFGIAFSQGQEYIVYANETDGRIWAYWCNSPVEIVHPAAAAHLAYLSDLPRMTLNPGFLRMTMMRTICLGAVSIVFVTAISAIYLKRRRITD